MLFRLMKFVKCELCKLWIFNRKPLEIKSCTGGFHGSDNRFPSMQVRFENLYWLLFSASSDYECCGCWGLRFIYCWDLALFSPCRRDSTSADENINMCPFFVVVVTLKTGKENLSFQIFKYRNHKIQENSNWKGSQEVSVLSATQSRVSCEMRQDYSGFRAIESWKLSSTVTAQPL